MGCPPGIMPTTLPPHSLDRRLKQPYARRVRKENPCLQSTLFRTQLPAFSEQTARRSRARTSPAPDHHDACPSPRTDSTPDRRRPSLCLFAWATVCQAASAGVKHHDSVGADTLPCMTEPVFLHRDARVIVLEKPSGLLAVPGRGPDRADCLSSRVQACIPTAVVVHRLDRDTSGLMLMALDPDAQRQLSGQFERREVGKRYECMVLGGPADDCGLIDRPIARDPARPPRYRIDAKDGRGSQTRWRVLERLADRTRLEVEPITGRSHQIRLHLATIGHPILGDPLYAEDGAAAAASRLLLHATRLTIAHPDDGRPTTWTSPCPF